MSDKEKKIKVSTPSANEKKSKKKMYLMLGGATLLLVAIGSLTAGGDKKTVFKKQSPEFINLTPGENKDWRTEMQMQYQAILRNSEEINTNSRRSLEVVSQALEEVRRHKNTIDSINSRLSKVEKGVGEAKTFASEVQSRPQSITPANDNSLEARIQRQLQQTQPAESSDNNSKLPTIGDNDLKRRVLPPPPGVPYSHARETGEPKVDVLTREINTKKKDSPLVFKAREDNYNESLNAVPTESVYKTNEYAGFIPPGAFAKVALLSGLDSGTSEYTRANPQPVLMRVQSNAKLPQGNYQVQSCFVLGSSYGDLSSERVFIQLSRITCVDTSQSMMLTGSIQGFVTDSDSIQGLKGNVIRRNGALLGKSMLAGFASGLSSVAAQAGTNQVTTIGGAINTTLDTDRILETGGMEGIGSTMELIAKQYMDEAKNMFPVISVAGGRIGTMILTQGSKLEWKSYLGKYEKDTKPSALHHSIF